MKPGWGKKRLGEVVVFQRGLTYSKKDQVDLSSNIVLRANNIDLLTNKLNFEELKYIKDNFYVPVEKKVTKGSLLICTASGSKKHLGKVALIDKDYDYAFGAFMGQITPKTTIQSKYLFYILISPAYSLFIEKLSDGVNINNLKFNDLKEFSFPLPPLPEQERIVSILDEAFEAIDRAKENAGQNLRNARELFESVLQGVFANPGDGWEQKKLGELCEVIAGQSPKGKYYNSDGKGLPFYQGKKEFTDKFIGPPKIWTTSITREAHQGDILMSVRAPVGPINFSTEKICIGRGLAAIRPIEKIYKEFLFYFLLNHEKKIIGNPGAVFNSINKTQIQEMTICLPSIPVQVEIVAKLDALSAETKQLEAIYQQKLDDLEELKQSILHKAFEGGLTAG